MKVIRNEENEPNIAKMIMDMIDQVNDELPEEMYLDEICELAVLAWNISLTDLEENKIAWSIPLRQQVQKMVAYKRKKFIDIKKEIVDIELDEENGLYVECEDPDDTDYFDEDFENDMMEMPDPATDFDMVDRNAVLVAPKKPFFAWLNHLYPKDPIKEHQMNDHHIYLIHEVGSDQEFEDWLSNHYVDLFENELAAWHTNQTDWPKPMSLALFKKWFQVQLHSIVYDFEQDALTKDNFC
ncbi:MAG: hypothetical protein ACFCUL_05670 [Flavobacteriaceae bacterium]